MKQYVAFTVNGCEYMLPILKVREIVSLPELTALPGLPEYVRGVVDMRGSVIPVMSLEAALGGVSEHRGDTVIVVSIDRAAFGVIVDTISGVISVDDEQIERAAASVFCNSGILQGVVKMENRLVLLLDPHQILSIDDVTLISESIQDNKEPASPLSGGDMIKLDSKDHEIEKTESEVGALMRDCGT